MLCHYGNSKSDQVTLMVRNKQVCVSKPEHERAQRLLNASLHTSDATYGFCIAQGLLQSMGGADDAALLLTIETKKRFVDIPLTFADK